MLHPFDDYPIHQTPDPILHVATQSADAYDRFFYNGFSPDGEVFFAIALGVYPNRRVMDGAFSVIRNAKQHNVRASRTAPADKTDTVIGPIQIEVIEPMRSHRITIGEEHGLSADLLWTSTSPAIEEPRFNHSVDGRTLFDYTRLTQFGTWQGWIRLDDELIKIGPGTDTGDSGSGSGGEEVVGVRDRSWGVRPVGDRIAGPATAPQFFWIWAPTVFDDRCSHLALNHLSDGMPWHQSGAVVPRITSDEPVLDPGRVQRGTTADIEVVWEPGTRWARSITTKLGMWQAEPIEISYEPIVRFQMSGIGYRHPEWGHGRWISDEVSTRDVIDLATVNAQDPTMVHVQALSRARWGDRTGIGIVEQLIVGPHEPTGLTGIIDGA